MIRPADEHRQRQHEVLKAVDAAASEAATAAYLRSLNGSTSREIQEVRREEEQRGRRRVPLR